MKHLRSFLITCSLCNSQLRLKYKVTNVRQANIILTVDYYDLKEYRNPFPVCDDCKRKMLEYEKMKSFCSKLLSKQLKQFSLPQMTKLFDETVQTAKEAEQFRVLIGLPDIDLGNEKITRKTLTTLKKEFLPSQFLQNVNEIYGLLLSNCYQLFKNDLKEVYGEGINKKSIKTRCQTFINALEKNNQRITNSNIKERIIKELNDLIDLEGQGRFPFPFNWKISDAHLELLSRFVDGQFVSSVDFFSSYLKEPYELAIKRFVFEELLKEPALELKVWFKFNTTELKDLAGKYHFKKSGSKTELSKRLIEAIGITEVEKLVNDILYFECTDKGLEIAKQYLTDRENKLIEYERRVCEFLMKGKLGDALQEWKNFSGSNQYIKEIYQITHYKENLPPSAARLERVYKKIPKSHTFSHDELNQVHAIASMPLFVKQARINWYDMTATKTSDDIHRFADAVSELLYEVNYWSIH